MSTVQVLYAAWSERRAREVANRAEALVEELTDLLAQIRAIPSGTTNLVETIEMAEAARAEVEQLSTAILHLGM